MKEKMDQYKLENKGTVNDYSNFTIDDMRKCVEKVYYLQKQYLYSFTISEYYNGTKSLEECFKGQKKKLQQLFQLSLLNEEIEGANETTIRALFMNLIASGYLGVEHLEIL